MSSAIAGSVFMAGAYWLASSPAAARSVAAQPEPAE